MPLIRYLQDKLPEWLHLSNDRPIELERAHRAARQPPRPITIRFLRFTDKERFLQATEINTIAVGNAFFGKTELRLSVGLIDPTEYVELFGISAGVFRDLFSVHRLF
jgi:hypothetical protein